MIRRPPRSTQSRSSAASDVYKRQPPEHLLVVVAVVSQPLLLLRPVEAVSNCPTTAQQHPPAVLWRFRVSMIASSFHHRHPPFLPHSISHESVWGDGVSKRKCCSCTAFVSMGENGNRFRDWFRAGTYIATYIIRACSVCLLVRGHVCMHPCVCVDACMHALPLSHTVYIYACCCYCC